MIQQLKTPNDTKIKSNTQTYFSTFNFPYMCLILITSFLKKFFILPPPYLRSHIIVCGG